MARRDFPDGADAQLRPLDVGRRRQHQVLCLRRPAAERWRGHWLRLESGVLPPQPRSQHQQQVPDRQPPKLEPLARARAPERRRGVGDAGCPHGSSHAPRDRDGRRVLHRGQPPHRTTVPESCRHGERDHQRRARQPRDRECLRRVRHPAGAHVSEHRGGGLLELGARLLLTLDGSAGAQQRRRGAARRVRDLQLELREHAPVPASLRGAAHPRRGGWHHHATLIHRADRGVGDHVLDRRARGQRSQRGADLPQRVDAGPTLVAALVLLASALGDCGQVPVDRIGAGGWVFQVRRRAPVWVLPVCGVRVARLGRGVRQAARPIQRSQAARQLWPDREPGDRELQVARSPR